MHVLKGEKSFPVFLTTFTVVDKDTHEKIPWEEYKKLSKEEKKQYNFFPKNQVFNVFNVAQTNLQEVRTELYAKLEEQCSVSRPVKEGEVFSFPVIDAMIYNNAWVCPIKLEHQDKAFYSLSKDHIVVPTKEQFIDGESFYGTLLHEMTHSTGSENRLNRLKPTTFGSEEYGCEELVAELGSALVCQQNGIQKHVKGDSAAYLKNWLESLEKSPDFIRSVMTDVKKATAVITYRMQEVQQQIDNGVEVKPYSHEDAIFDPSLVPEEVPFKEKPNVEKRPEVVAAMGGHQKAHGGFLEVNVTSLFGALKRDGEAKLSDHLVGNEKDKETELTEVDKQNIKVMHQYDQMKKKHPDAILLFRIGDSYEIYKDDAIRASSILGISLENRNIQTKKNVAVSTFKENALDTYLPKLVRAGCRVAICEQLEDPKLKQGSEQVKRDETGTQTRGLRR